MTDNPALPTPPARSAILAIILVSYFLIVLGNSIVFTGLPDIAAELAMSPTGLSWVQNAYTLVFGGLLLLGARSGDILGRRPVFIAGLIVFSVASLLIGFSTSGAWLIAMRAVQGLGAAVLAPSSLSLLTATFEGTARTRAVAAYGAVAGIGASLGMVIGGALAQTVSWRAGFFLNVPIGLVLIWAAVRFIPAEERSPGRFDLVGAVTSTLGVGALVFGIIESSTSGWDSPAALVPIGAAVVLLVALVVNEARVSQPIMPLSLFASRIRSGSYVARLLFAGTMIGFYYFLTQLLQGSYGYTPLQTGLAFLPLTVTQLVSATAVPRLTARLGNSVLLAIGLAVTTAAMILISFLHEGTPYATGIALPMILLGLGQGLGFGPLTAASLTGATAENAGAASGMVNAMHQIGSTLGVAILVTVAAGAADLVGSTALAFIGGTVMLVVALAAVLIFVVPPEVIARRRGSQIDGSASHD